MDDPGDPISYQVLEPGTPVYSSDDAHVGSVRRVLADDSAAIFHGLVIDARSDLHVGHRDRFVAATQVESMHERAVKLGLDADACQALPEPGPDAD